MKVLVTGGAGFIGSHVVDALIAKGFDVRVLDIKTFEKKGVECVQADIRDNEAVLKAVKECDYVIHLAALMSVPESNEKPEEYTSVNVTGTKNLLEAAKKNSVKRVIVASTAAVYTKCNPPFDETQHGEPLSVYAANKLENEKACKEYTEKGLECVSLRFMNVFGPGQDADAAYAAAVPKFITQLLKGKTPTIFGDGEQTRDFIYVRNVAEAIVRSLTAPSIAGEILNVATGNSITVNELLKVLCKKMNLSFSPNYTSPRSGDAKFCEVSITKSFSSLDNYNLISFEEGLDETIEYYRRQA